MVALGTRRSMSAPPGVGKETFTPLARRPRRPYAVIEETSRRRPILVSTVCSTSPRRPSILYLANRAPAASRPVNSNSPTSQARVYCPDGTHDSSTRSCLLIGGGFFRRAACIRWLTPRHAFDLEDLGPHL